jgi:hypothetical protein
LEGQSFLEGGDLMIEQFLIAIIVVVFLVIVFLVIIFFDDLIGYNDDEDIIESFFYESNQVERLEDPNLIRNSAKIKNHYENFKNQNLMKVGEKNLLMQRKIF